MQTQNILHLNYSKVAYLQPHCSWGCRKFIIFYFLLSLPLTSEFKLLYLSLLFLFFSSLSLTLSTLFLSRWSLPLLKIGFRCEEKGFRSALGGFRSVWGRWGWGWPWVGLGSFWHGWPLVGGSLFSHKTPPKIVFSKFKSQICMFFHV